MKLDGTRVIFDLNDSKDIYYIEVIIESLEKFDHKNSDLKLLGIAIARATKHIKCYARPVGTDSIPGCFVCGKAGNPFLANICLLVNSQEEAELVEGMLLGSRIDYWHGDRNAPQVKIGACPDHLTELNTLYTACACAREITEWIISRAKWVKR